MKPFLKYLGLGVVVLVLQMSFPECRVAWLALLLAPAAITQGPRFAILLSAVLSLLFSFFSVQNGFGFFLPFFLVLVLWGLAPKWFSFHEKIETFLLIFSLALAPEIFPLHLETLAKDSLWAALSAALGVAILSRISAWFRRIWLYLLGWRRRPQALQGLEKRRRALASLQTPRGPFGLHKGI